MAENQMDTKMAVKRRKQEEIKIQLEAKLQKKYTTTWKYKKYKNSFLMKYKNKLFLYKL